MDRQGGHGRRRSHCQQKASLKDNHNHPPTHCQPSFSLLTVSLSASVSWFLVFFLHCLLTCILSDVVLWAIGRVLSQLQFCGSWMYNTVSVFVCVALLISMSIFCPLCDCPPTQQWKKEKSVNAKGQWTKLWKYVHVQIITFLWFDLNVDIVFELLYQWPIDLLASGQVKRNWEYII